MKFPNIYEFKHYKLFVIVPVLLILVSLVFFVPKIPQGIDLKGGQLITIFTDQDISSQQISAALAEFNPSSVRAFNSPSGKGFEIELPSDEKLSRGEQLLGEVNSLDQKLVELEIAQSPLAGETREQVSAKAKDLAELASPGVELTGDAHGQVKQAQEAFLNARSAYRQKISDTLSKTVSITQSSFKEVGSSLSKFFFAKIQEVILYSFILSAVIIFLVFRSFVPSVAVIFGAAADVIITAGVMGLLGIPLTLASVAALLMLIGFSLDTDVMLTARVLRKREGTPEDWIFGAMKTGFMMNFTTIAAFGVLSVLAFFLQIPVYYEIGMVAVIGAFADFIATWMGNAVMIFWYAKKQEHKHAQ